MDRTLKTFIILSLLWLMIACSPSLPPLQTISGKTMGTTYTVKYVSNTHDDISAQHKRLSSRIDSQLIDINQLMSTYIPNSELSLLNSIAAQVPFEVSSETAFVINEAKRLHALSQGMLDITVGPLVNLWGFGPDARPDKLPSDDQLADISDYVGIDKFTINNNIVTKHHNKVYIDLSTIAKGYAVDQLATILEEQGITNYLVEIGGEMRLSGTKPQNQDWLVAIEKPMSGERSVQSIINIGNNAIASSGDYRNYFEENGRRYSHLIDPTTGYPIQHNLVSVSVITSSSMTADGLATALIVLGKDRGFEIAESNNIAALFITKEGEDFVEYATSAYNDTVKTIK